MPDIDQKQDPHLDMRIENRARELMQEFGSLLVHEIRASVHNLLSLSYAMKSVGVESERDRVYEAMKLEIYRLTRILDNVYFADPGHVGVMRVDLHSVDLVDLVRRSLDNYAPLGEKRGISFRFKYDQNRLMVRADSYLIGIALSNIIHNAIKYAGSNTYVEVAVERADGKARVIVVDWGLGISSEDMRGIFSPFFRGSVERSGHFSIGTGLGLYVSREIIKAHHGSIKIESNPTHGSQPNLGKERNTHLVRVVMLLPLEQVDGVGSDQ